MCQKKTFGQSQCIKQRLNEKEITNLNSLKLNIKQRLHEKEITNLNSLKLYIKQRLDEKITNLNSLKLYIKQRLDVKEITNLNSLKLYIKKIWWVLLTQSFFYTKRLVTVQFPLYILSLVSDSC